MKLLEPFPQDRFTDAKEVINALFPGVKIEKKISLPFVGREEILKKMKDSIEKRIKKGFNAPSTVLIYGGTGMGKTALLKEFAKNLSLEGIKVLRERESATHPPLFTLIKELSMRASLNLVNRYRDELITFYPELSNIFEGRGPHKGEPTDFKKIIYFINEAISEIKDFHVILIDDLHSSLPDGINLFNFLSENLCEKAIIIATGNPDLLKKSIEIKGKKIKLPGLLPEDIKELLFINFGEMSLVDELTERTYRWTSGNPLLIRKSLNLYLREGVIKEREGVYHANIENLESDKISFSKDIDTFFKHKLEELDKDTNEFLSYFSAIGEEFPRKLISLFSK
ncbi:ATP-binding protein, partial [candidate division WOR-3 bacterium]|nr:ATP-binding protein [candidate division WOR-3 bacterium]